MLAAAGLNRLGKTNVGSPIPGEMMLPAPTQAVLALECRADDMMTQTCLKLVDDGATHTIINAERAFTRALGACCHSPVAALATIEKGNKLRLRAQLLTEDGSAQVTDEVVFDCGDLDAPRRLAEAMLKAAPEPIRRLFAGG